MGQIRPKIAQKWHMQLPLYIDAFVGMEAQPRSPWVRTSHTTAAGTQVSVLVVAKVALVPFHCSMGPLLQLGDRVTT